MRPYAAFVITYALCGILLIGALEMLRTNEVAAVLLVVATVLLLVTRGSS